MKTLILILFPLFGFSQSYSGWMDSKRCMYKTEETNCVIKVQNCYKKIYVGDNKLFYVEQNEKNILQWRRMFIKDQKTIKCK